jgi:hypothetical protein
MQYRIGSNVEDKSVSFIEYYEYLEQRIEEFKGEDYSITPVMKSEKKRKIYLEYKITENDVTETYMIKLKIVHFH